MLIRHLLWGFLACVAFWAPSACARTWTDASGEFKIDAELIRVADDGKSVALRRTDGEEITLKIADLSDDDKKFLDNHDKPNAKKGAKENPFLTHKERATVAPAAKVNHRRALLVGVNEYKHFRKLEYCGSDVQALGKRLTAAGFDRDKVVVVHDAATRSLQPDKEKIVNQITLLLNSAAADDLIFLAFSGHGVRIGGKSYLVPYEGQMPQSMKDEERLKSLISLDWLYEQLQECPAATKIFLVDACQNRLFSGDQRAVRSNVEAESIGQSLQSAPKSVLLMTACAPGEVSHESADLKHGVYTHFLLEALEGRADYNHDGIVSLKEANLYASEKTEHFVRVRFSETQRPSFKGEMQGDVPLAECLLMDRITVPDDIDRLDVAIRRLALGGTLRIRTGLHKFSESLEITREATIVGDGAEPKDVVLECAGKSAIVMKAPHARFQTLSIRNTGTDEPAVLVSDGRFEMLRCDVTSEKGGGLTSSGKSVELRLSDCAIHDAGDHGLSFRDGAKGLVENCRIFGNASSNVVSKSDQNPVFRDCRIYKSQGNGVFVNVSGTGLFDSCEIHDNEYPNVCIGSKGNPTFTGCKIHGSKQFGAWLYENALGTFEKCDIYGNGSANVCVETGGKPTFKGGKIHDGEASGLYFREDGHGTFNDCSVFANAYSNVLIGPKSNPKLVNCRIYESQQYGLWIREKGAGSFEDCDIHGNVLPNVEITTEGAPTLKGCKIRNSKNAGVVVREKGLGTLDGCDISANAYSNVIIYTNANPTVKGCQIHASKQHGVWVKENGEGTFGDCDIFENSMVNVQVQGGGNPTFTACKMHDAAQNGVYVFDQGAGTFQKCRIYDNKYPNVCVRTGGNPLVDNCTIYNGSQSGVTVKDDGAGTFRNCKVYGNEYSNIGVESGGNPTIKNCSIYNSKSRGISIGDGGAGVFENNTLSGNAKGPWLIDANAGAFRRSGNSPSR